MNATATMISGMSNAVCTTAQLAIEASVYTEKKLVSRLTDKSEEQIAVDRMVQTYQNAQKVKTAINNLQDRIRNRKVDYKKLGLA